MRALITSFLINKKGDSTYVFSHNSERNTTASCSAEALVKLKKNEYRKVIYLMEREIQKSEENKKTIREILEKENIEVEFQEIGVLDIEKLIEIYEEVEKKGLQIEIDGSQMRRELFLKVVLSSIIYEKIKGKKIIQSFWIHKSQRKEKKEYMLDDNKGLLLISYYYFLLTNLKETASPTIIHRIVKELKEGVKEKKRKIGQKEEFKNEKNEWKEIEKAIEELKRILERFLRGRVGTETKRIYEEWKKKSEDNEKIPFVLKRIILEIGDVLKEKEIGMRQINLAKFFYEKGDPFLAMAMLREGIITLFMEKMGKKEDELFKKNERIKYENLLTAGKKEDIGTILEIFELRNTLIHFKIENGNEQVFKRIDNKFNKDITKRIIEDIENRIKNIKKPRTVLLSTFSLNMLPAEKRRAKIKIEELKEEEFFEDLKKGEEIIPFIRHSGTLEFIKKKIKEKLKTELNQMIYRYNDGDLLYVMVVDNPERKELSLEEVEKLKKRYFIIKKSV